ncbi:MAG: aspartate carbamoyltransferase regulatory subunit [Aigarchaeota archaeon]|nr:aspartate carbamoyltransferase regulatory subunit [Aigarchaeota archaeon]MDW8092562.1 aspartate carbamoyltransferase regulatory subunit [Nitrososphaerota archaeon]
MADIIPEQRVDEEKIYVSKIEKGVVIDHIDPCKGLLVYKALNPEPDATSVIAKNVSSKRLGRKDLVKIEGEYLASSQIDLIALISPRSTVNIIDGWRVKEKRRVKPPTEITYILDCKNPVCASRGQMSAFRVNLKEPIEHSHLDCTYCGYRVFYNEAIEAILNKASSNLLFSRSRIKREFLNLLLSKGGLRTEGGYVLKSKRVSPYFVNLGALNDGESLSRLRWILAGYAWILLNEGEIEDFDFIFGPAYKGINLAALTCEGFNEYVGLNKRYIYDRKEIKTYGDTSMDMSIVGAEYLKGGQKILVVDDTITTGFTKVESVKKIIEMGENKVVGVLVCVDRQELSEDGSTATEKLERALNVKVFSILTAREIFESLKPRLDATKKNEWIEYYEKYGAIKLH